jgi:prevent-host-death family protein
MLTRRMTAKQARDNFTDLLGLVYYGKESVIVEKKGRPFAVVISPKDFESYKKAAKDRFFETVEEIQQDNKGVDPDEVLEDITEAVEQVRQENYDKEKGRQAQSSNRH